MAIINDFKAIKDACNAISTDILGPKKKPEPELEIEFEADEDVEEMLNKKARWPSKTTAAPPAPANPVPQAAAMPHCMRCLSRRILRKSAGFWCRDCQDYI